MSAANDVLNEHENRVDIITAIAIEVNALLFSEATREVIPADNTDAEKLVYARAFQAWADGKIEGNAEDVFETVQEVLEI
ncbi:MAG TPA: hypothetical protein VHB49_19355 [Bradyrhizobium sp.]|nr:hypothetical protein [Bradyrhizobium sp.]